MKEINRIRNGDVGFQPILQVTSIKGLSAATDKPVQRYRLTLSDGEDSIPGMLAIQMNDLIESESLHVGSMVRLTEFVVNDLQNQKVVILLNLEITGSDSNFPQATHPHLTPPQQSTASSSNQYQSTSSLPLPPRHSPSRSSNQNPYDAQRAKVGLGNSNSNNPYQSNINPYPTNNYPSNNKPIVREDLREAITPISALNPYSNRWTIKARITNKSEMRRWSNARGDGTLFSIDLLDSTGGEIRATFFKAACDKWFPILEEQQVYTFSGGRLKVGDKKFTAIKNDYELTFDANSEIHPVTDDSDIKTMSYSFTKISTLATKEVNSSVDVLAIVRSATDVSELVSTKLGGKVLYKRDLVIYDDSGFDIRLTLWGDKAQANTPWSEGPIIACKGLIVGDYNGRTLSVRQTSSIAINPPLDEAFALHEWRMNGGETAPSASMTTGGSENSGGPVPLEQRITIASIKEDGLGLKEKPDYVGFKGTVTYIRHENEPWYTGCPTPNCNRKVVEGFNQQWTCEKCNKEFPNCIRRYVLSLTMADHSGQSWFSMFNDSAAELLGCTAEELYEIKMSGDTLRYEEIFTQAQFKTFTAKARIKQESVNDELRVKCSITRLDQIDYNNECKQMIDAINKYM